MKKIKNKFRRFRQNFYYYAVTCKAYVLVWIVVLLFLPFLFSFLIKNFECIRLFSNDSLLVFWGGAISISVNIILKFIKEMEVQKLKYSCIPKIGVEISRNPETEDCFILNVYADEHSEYTKLYAEGEFVCYKFKDVYSVYLYPDDEENENEGWIPVKIGEDGYPVSLILGVDDSIGQSWSICYKKVRGSTKPHYVFESAYIL